MNERIEKVQRLLNDEKDSLQKLLKEREKLERLIKNHQELVWKREDELQEVKDEHNG